MLALFVLPLSFGLVLAIATALGVVFGQWIYAANRSPKEKSKNKQLPEKEKTVTVRSPASAAEKEKTDKLLETAHESEALQGGMALPCHTLFEIPDECRKDYVNAAQVGIAVKILHIGHVDMANHSFAADINVNVAWVGGKDDQPHIQIYNAIEVVPEELEPKKGAEGFDWYFRTRYKGTFRQQFDLHDFPYDAQELTVVVRLKKACELVPLPWDSAGNACVCDPRALGDDFSLKSTEVRNTYLPSFKFGKLAGYDPEAQLVFSVKRKPLYWVLNFGLLTTILASFSFLVFTLPVGEISDRLGIGFTLNLTVVASYNLMSDKLPSAPYFTQLQKHILVCMAVTGLVLLENASTALIGDDNVAWGEKYILPYFLLLWCVYHFMHFRKVMQHRNEQQ